MTPEQLDELEGREPGTSDNVYYFSIYTPVTLDRVAVEHQNILCKGVWKDWMQKYPGWRNLLVYSSRQPGPETLSNASPEAQELVWMHKFLEGNGVLPPRPRPIYATIAELEDQHPWQMVESIRSDLAKLRGKLFDLYTADKLWKDRLTPAEGGITCVLQSLADAVDDMKKHHDKWGHNPQWLKPIKENECTTK